MKRARGRPVFKATEADYNTVRTMAACGFAHDVIAECLGEKGIDKKTLYKHFRHDLDVALAKANTLIGSVAFQAAARGEPWAVCFWLKCRAKWQEVVRYEHSGPEGKPIAVDAGMGTARERIRRRLAEEATRTPAGLGTERIQ